MDGKWAEGPLHGDSEQQQSHVAHQQHFRVYSSHSRLGACVRHTFVMADLCVLLSSIVSASYGLWLYVRYSHYGPVIQCDMHGSVAVLLALLGAIAVANVAAGLHYAVSGLRYYLFLHGCAHMLLALLFTLTAVLAMVFTRQVPLPVVELQLRMSLTELYGRPRWQHVTYAWDDIQMRYGCCGVSTPPWDYTVWHRSKWYMWVGSRLSNETGVRSVVPMSCCAVEPDDGQYKDVHACAGAKGAKKMRQAINMTPCAELFMDDLVQWVDAAAKIAFASAFCALVPAALGVLYSDMIQK